MGRAYCGVSVTMLLLSAATSEITSKGCQYDFHSHELNGREAYVTESHNRKMTQIITQMIVSGNSILHPRLPRHH